MALCASRRARSASAHGTTRETPRRRSWLGIGLHEIACVVAVGAILLGLIVIPVRPASACSCEIPDPMRTFNESPAAFIGTVIDVRPLAQPQDFMDVVYVFEVDEWVKGDLGETVEIASSQHGASCGFDLVPGDTTGVWVRQVENPLVGGLCDRIDPDALRASAIGLPEPAKTGGRATMLAVGSFGSVGVIALDEMGEIIGYGPPAHSQGWFSSMSVCPGGRMAVELVPDLNVFVRDLRTLEIVESMTVNVGDSEDSFTYFTDVVCRSSDASETLLFGIETGEFSDEHDEGEEEKPPDETGVIYSRTGGDFDVLAKGIFSGEGSQLAVAGDVAVTTAGHDDPTLIVIDLSTGSSTAIYRYTNNEYSTYPPSLEGLALSPSGRHVAVIDANLTDPGVEYFLSTFDLDAEDPLTARAPMTEAGTPVFVDDSVVAYILSYHEHEEDSDDEIGGEKSGFVQLFDVTNLDLVNEWAGWEDAPPVAVGGVFYAVTEGGRVLAAPATSGPVVEFTHLPGSFARLVPLSDPIELATSAAETPTEASASPGVVNPAFAAESAFKDDGLGGIARVTPLIVIALLVMAAATMAWLTFFRPGRERGARGEHDV